MSSGTDERLCDDIQQRNGNFIEGFVSVVDQTETKPKKCEVSESDRKSDPGIRLVEN
jgi:hypothetical protein